LARAALVPAATSMLCAARALACMVGGSSVAVGLRATSEGTPGSVPRFVGQIIGSGRRWNGGAVLGPDGKFSLEFRGG
jgi:hypothetical protein